MRREGIECSPYVFQIIDASLCKSSTYGHRLYSLRHPPPSPIAHRTPVLFACVHCCYSPTTQRLLLSFSSTHHVAMLAYSSSHPPIHRRYRIPRRRHSAACIRYHAFVLPSRFAATIHYPHVFGCLSIATSYYPFVLFRCAIPPSRYRCFRDWVPADLPYILSPLLRCPCFP